MISKKNRVAKKALLVLFPRSLISRKGKTLNLGNSFKELSYAILGQVNLAIKFVFTKVFDCVWIDSFKIIKVH